MSTDKFQVIHDGARATRFDKLEALKHSDSIRRLLRTCYVRRDGLRNCGRCQNCRRTMMVLAALGILDQFETFPRVRSPLHFINSRWDTPHELLFGRQAIHYAAAAGLVGVAWAGRVAMLTSPARKFGTRIKERSRPFRRIIQKAINRILRINLGAPQGA